MSRLNLNSIFSWVDSHIIDHPLATNIKLSSLIFFVLFALTPIHGLIALGLVCLCLWFRRHWKFSFKLLLSFFLLWYMVFTLCLLKFDGSIIIYSDFVGCGSKCESSARLYSFVFASYLDPLYEPNWLEFSLGRFCMLTIFFLSFLSGKIGMAIHIPFFLRPILEILKMIWGGGPTPTCTP